MNQRIPLAELQPRHFGWSVADRVATVTLNRPERKNPLTFDSYRAPINPEGGVASRMIRVPRRCLRLRPAYEVAISSRP